MLLWAGLRVYNAQAAYQGASDEIDTLQVLADSDLSELQSEEVAEIEQHLDKLRLELRRLDDATSLPFGAESLVSKLPWIGPRYQAGRDVLKLGLLLTDASATSASIGREALHALDQTGISTSEDEEVTSPTWLDVVSNHEREIEQIRRQIEQAEALRNEIDVSLLPERTQSQLGTIDRAMDRIDESPLSSIDVDLLESGLGADQPARYLLFFQNPAELRPSGGFPGTIALVTIEDGQLSSYEFMDVRDLTYDYIDQRETKRPEPWPIDQYFPQNGFLIHDATWFADFPRSGETVMSMYAETDWPPINGIIAIEPTAISRVLEVTGPVTVMIDEKEVQITAENFYDEIEGQRRRRRAGEEVETTHKEAVGVIGNAILDRLKSMDRNGLVNVLKAGRESADRRDLQFYSKNEEIQAALAKRQWTGSITPNPDTPTLAMTMANVAVNKASLNLEPSMTLTFNEGEGDRRSVTLKLDLRNTGSDDPLYEDFQSWWIDMRLPTGSELQASAPEPIPHPEPPNGGSYLIQTFANQIGTLEITFTMPASDQLLIRRQPGLQPIHLTAINNQCGKSVEETLDKDLTLSLTAICNQ